jgi:hypothetical protein
MTTLHDETTTDVITTLEIVRVALSDIDIREMVLDEMDLSDEEAKRILMKVNDSLREVQHGPQG